MTRYYFDVRDGDTFTKDEIGAELPSIDRVWEEATKGATEMLRDEMPKQSSSGHQIVIEVRDDAGPVLSVKVIYQTRYYR